ncbi:glycerol-3-phosphate 1-O-acyltransferase PlsY [Neptuniibacter halophilus]|uniref:glycerol-3-phosphate 1-O-acyltransferase PlsY n=1 Tax=Neptuniibacter halophilus TaxID=651666 RepID=UPI0025744650|nr:glycerol-3-phosphate 1-O-acyltransferase PlsY [Neptuniibacter halophilus]
MSDPVEITLGLVFLAYLWGSVPTAVLVCHALDIPDPRARGSGNPGTTNVLRIGTPKAAGLTLLGDAGKGFLALLPGLLLGLSDDTRSYCALAAVIGHMFPLFSAFRGGKGVATTFGACLGLFWPLAVVQLLIWGLVAVIGRIASLASIACALIAPLFIWLVAPDLLITLCLIGLLLLFSHRNNIRNLLQGAEPRL